MSFLKPLTRSARDGVGQPVLRKDDARLLVGDGCYSDDVNLPGQAYACFVRSPHAHARVGRIDTAAALATPGVIAVLTGADAVADGLKPLTHSPMPANPHEEIVRRQHVAFLAPHPPMPADRVRFVGEVVAMVIADTPAAARDGAERVVVEWTPVAAGHRQPGRRRSGRSAASTTGPRRTCAWTCRSATPATADTAFASAAHVVRLRDVDPAGHRRADGAARGGGRVGSRRADATPSTPAPAAWDGRAPGWPGRSASPRARSAWWRATSAEISARATAATRSSRWWPGRRDASAGR